MDSFRTGALAAATSLDGSRLKVLVVGQGGVLSEANAQLGDSSPEISHLPNYIGLADAPGVLGSTWTDGGVVDAAHPKSAISVCTIEQLNLICVFYQVSDGSIVMRRCHMGGEWKWETGKWNKHGFLGSLTNQSYLRYQDNHRTRPRKRPLRWNESRCPAHCLTCWRRLRFEPVLVSDLGNY